VESWEVVLCLGALIQNQRDRLADRQGRFPNGFPYLEELEQQWRKQSPEDTPASIPQDKPQTPAGATVNKPQTMTQKQGKAKQSRNCLTESRPFSKYAIKLLPETIGKSTSRHRFFCF